MVFVAKTNTQCIHIVAVLLANLMDNSRHSSGN